MNTSRLRPIALVTVLVATACNPFHRGQAVEVSTGDAMLNSRWHANLASPSSLAGVVQMNGSASMAPDRSGISTIVVLDLANASPGGVHPWEMRRGRCGNGTDYGVFGSTDAYSAVEVDSDGHAEGKATIPMQTPVSGDYFVVVHASRENAGTVVACGNLAPPTR
jgi:hypothetical protein